MRRIYRMVSSRILSAVPITRSLADSYVYREPDLKTLIDKAVNGQASVASYLSPARVSRKMVDDAWDSGINWDKACELATRGDADGARRLRPDMIRTMQEVMRMVPRLDPEFSLDGGQWIDIARYVKGEPECWGSMVPSGLMPSVRSIAIVLNAATPHGLHAESIDIMGVALGGAVLGLQALGYTVTLYWAKKLRGTIDKEKYFYLSAPLNPQGSALDIAMLSAMIRPWFLRRIGFSYYEMLDPVVRKAIGFFVGPKAAYGASQLMSVTEAQELTGENNVVVIDTMKFVNEPSAVKDAIINQIKGGKPQ